MALEEYGKKRDFGRTPEPPAKVRTGASSSLEYVIQKHDATSLHYDFRLELDGVLKSWAVPKGPSLRPGVKRLAMETEDHPMDYGGFEGVIPEGQYGGGTVMLWDRGEWIPEGDPREGYRKGRLRFRLKGEKLVGDWILTRMKPKPGEKKTAWLLIKSRDPAAREEEEPDITEEQPRSVVTGRDLEAIAAEQDRVWDGKEGEKKEGKGKAKAKGEEKEKAKAKAKAGEVAGARKGTLPSSPKAQLATLVTEAPEGDEWLHEIKFDGYRVLCRIDRGEVRLLTRNGNDWTDRFPGLAEALGELPCERALVDGEVVGLREDKSAEEVVREREKKEELRVAGVRVTSPDKVLWAEQGVTKGELVEYYVAVEDAVLPRLVDRPLTLVRCPSGAESKCFYQKHANDSVPDMIPRVPVEEKDGTEPYMYVDGLPSLVALVQLGVLEFHVWGARRDRLERPDRLVFDLDPDEDLPFGRVAAAALRLRELLGELGLESWPKSTGGKGLHVVVPIVRRSDWDEAREFTQAVARRLVAEDPEGFTAQMSKSRRTGRIFVDYLRNARNATAIADYSTRARPGAPVAVPLSWDEVNPRARTPPLLSIRDVPARLAERGDPWTGFDDTRQSITAAMKGAVGLG